MLLLKNKSGEIIENLNSLRTAGGGSASLANFLDQTDLKTDFYELRDNGILEISYWFTQN